MVRHRRRTLLATVLAAATPAARGLEKTGRIGRIAIDPRNPERARGYVQIMTVKEPEEARPEEPAADPDE